MLKITYPVDYKLNDEEKVLTRVDYIEKREIDRSTLYSFDGPFQLIHADMGNLEFFLGKSTTAPSYTLLAVDLYSSKNICLSYAFKKTDSTKNKNILR